MKEKSNKKELKWYESGNIITSLIVGVIALIIICSQSFAVSSDSTLVLFGSIINHNSVYLLVVIYFIFLKLRIGKRYFNYLNVFLMFIYLLVTVTSLLTLVQSFSLNTTLTFILNFVFLIYLFHTMFRDTRIWKDFNLGESPFNELSNEWYFYTLIVISLILLAVNLISTVVIGGVVISILDTIYIVLFGRYIFLYREYLDYKKKDVNNKGNFDEIRENIKKTVDDVTDKVAEGTNELKDKVSNFIEENEIEEKISDIKDKVVEGTNELKDKVNDFIEENEIDEKVSDIKDKVVEGTNELKDKVNDFIEENEIDEKVSDIKNKVVEGTNELKDKVNDFIEENEIDEKVSDIKDKVVEGTNELKDNVSKNIKKSSVDKKTGRNGNNNGRRNNSKEKGNRNDIEKTKNKSNNRNESSKKGDSK